MNKSISLVKILGVQNKLNPKDNGYLKTKDIKVFESIKNRVCEELKKQMEMAIEQYNKDLDSKDFDVNDEVSK